MTSVTGRPGQEVAPAGPAPAGAGGRAEAEAAQLRTGLNPAVLAEALEETTPGHAPSWSATLAAGLPPAGQLPPAPAPTSPPGDG